MLSDFAENKVFLVFSSSSTSGGQASRVVGPFNHARFGSMGIWAYCLDAEGYPDGNPVRVATKKHDGAWLIDGLDDRDWGQVAVVSPRAGTTASDIERGTGWTGVAAVDLPPH